MTTPDEPGEDPTEEAGETPQQEAAEEASEHGGYYGMRPAGPPARHPRPHKPSTHTDKPAKMSAPKGARRKDR